MISIEATEGLERRMTLQLPASRVESEVQTRLKSVGKQARIKGFRPGKIPPKVVRQRFGPQVHSEVLAEMMQARFAEAIAKEKLSPAGRPRLEPKSISPGEDVEFVATFEVFPEIQLTGFDQMKVRKPVVEILDTDIDKMLEQLRTQRREWDPVDRAAVAGDRIVIDMMGTVDGEPFEDGSGTDVGVELGAGTLMNELETALAGMSAGESKVVPVPFPEGHPNGALAGKAAEFEVVVKHVDEARLPEIDEAFCDAFGIKDGGIDALRAEVRNNMEREREEATARRVRDQVISELVRVNPIDVPRALVDNEIISMFQDLSRRMGSAAPLSTATREHFEPEARRRVIAGLLLSETIRAGNIEVDEGRLDKRIESLASGYDDPQQFINSVRSNRQLAQELEARILEEQAVDWLTSKASLETESISFSELMGTQAA